MKLLTVIITLSSLLFQASALGNDPATINNEEGISMDVFRSADTLFVNIETDSPANQLSFLMQGLSICVKDTASAKELFVVHLPNAQMVKHKVKHHPNEVKAMLKNDSSEIRPDLQPLISALNDTLSVLKKDTVLQSCNHRITLDRENGIISIRVNIPIAFISVPDMVFLEISSSPMRIGNRKEFEGTRMSTENRMQKGGLGSEPNSMKDQKRIITYGKNVLIKDYPANSCTCCCCCCSRH